MSDTVRGYRSRRSGAATRRRPGLRALRTLTVALGLLLIVYAGWTTRDTIPVERLIPAGQKYEVAAADVLNKRGKMARSAVWQALPEQAGLARVPQAMTQSLGLPEWVLNNLVGERCHLSGNDLRTFSDVLFVTKMRPIGALLERFQGFIPGIETDAAGGLNLRRLANANLYYAVRGRVLLLSRSRDALIRAVTLREEDSLLATTPKDAAAGAGGEDLRGVVALAPDDPLGEAFQTVRFALRVDPAAAFLKCRATLSPAWKTRLSRILENAIPQTLSAPPEGLARVSANFGKPLKDVALGLGEAFLWPALSAVQWEAWESTPTEGPGLPHAQPARMPALPGVLTALLGAMGPGLRLSWRGMDLNEILPTPEVVGIFESGGQSLEKLFEAIPPPPAGAGAWDPFPRYDRGAKQVHMPLISGPSLEPTAAVYGDELLLSSSRTVANSLLAQTYEKKSLPQPGNLFIQVHPLPCVQAIADAARLLAESDLLRGYTRESLEQEIPKWLEQAGRLTEARILASHEQGEVVVEVVLECAPTAHAAGA